MKKLSVNQDYSWLTDSFLYPQNNEYMKIVLHLF